MSGESAGTEDGHRADLRRRNRRLGAVLLGVALTVLALPFLNHLIRGVPAQRAEDPPSEMVRRAGLLEGRGNIEDATALYERVLELEGPAPDTMKPLVRAARAGLARIAELARDSVP